MVSNVYIDRKWYFIFLGIITIFLASYLFTPLFYVGIGLLLLFATLTIIDYALLFKTQQNISAQRAIPEIFHLGAFNTIDLSIQNHTNLTYNFSVIEELPDIFQVRNFDIKGIIKAQELKELNYDLKAIKRGAYTFKRTIIYISSAIGFLKKRININHQHEIKIYPSTKLFKKYQLLAQTTQFALPGNRQLRKIGHSMEFDQIKEYVQGDDIRSINWKATARKNHLMVNNYIDEKSQSIYNIIDGGRLMHYTFDGLSLLDYAINTSLLISKIVLLKDDKVGLLLFNDKIKNLLIADKQPRQMLRINQLLYNFQTDFKDSSYERLVNTVSNKITQRSLLMLYTNFESITSFERQLIYFKQLAKKHLLCVIFFENTAIKEYTEQPNETLEEIFVSTIAEKYAFEKKQIVKQLKNLGIISIMTTPQQLNTDTINKYLEIKASQLI